MDRAIWQTGMTMLFRDLAGEDCPDRAVDVNDRQLRTHPLAALQSRGSELEQLIIQRGFQPMILFLNVANRDVRADGWLVKNHRQIKCLGFPMSAEISEFQHLGLPDHVVEFPESHLGHELPDFL